MITDTIDNSHCYHLGPVWEKAFEFLKNNERRHARGRLPNRRKGPVRHRDELPDQGARFEAHKKYADIQSTLMGAEGIAVVDTKNVDQATDYEEERDVSFFETPETIPTLVDVYPGSFAFLLPQDCHMPQLAVGAPQMIKKVVVKIALSELGL
jgi:YhcH/YjgK/YiaL family protein